ncbi:MAG: hypothetical protein Greene101447_359 [Parcubacteria group bacterium Greene1014_47]|nr:MAG: hypothetical protein Greene101447_359 [Parcubacteria group bacterium Greene1014_47]
MRAKGEEQVLEDLKQWIDRAFYHEDWTTVASLAEKALRDYPQWFEAAIWLQAARVEILALDSTQDPQPVAIGWGFIFAK